MLIVIYDILHIASPFTIPHLFTGLDLLLAVLEVGEPQPVEEERRHAEDEEEGEGVPPPPHRAVAQQQLGAEHAQPQHDVNISVREYSRGHCQRIVIFPKCCK